MSKKIRLEKENGFLWRVERGSSPNTGRWIIATKIHKLRHKNENQKSMVSDEPELSPDGEYFP